MHLLRNAALGALVAGTFAQSTGPFATYSTDGLEYNVNIPSATSSGSGNTIYFQLVAPSGTQWVGLGQGSQMSGSNIFMVYADGNGNVTVSPRLGKGEFQPSYGSSSAQISILGGSKSASDGSMTANIRCDDCLSWSGGSMSPTDDNSAWIWAVKNGDPIDSTSLSESLSQHDTMGTTSFKLSAGTGGSSSNPFEADTTSSSPASGTSGSTTTASGSQSAGSATATISSYTANPTGSSSGSSSSSSGSSSSSSPSNGTRTGHTVVMAFTFLVLMPFAAMTLYLPWSKRVPFIHAPLQVLAIILLIVGLALGVQLAKPAGQLGKYHQVIGYIVIAIPFSIQPALGVFQHIHFRKTGGRSSMGVIHHWLGRAVIVAGVVNGGLGMLQSGPVGNENVPSWAPIAYSIVAIVVAIIYAAVVIGTNMRRRNAGLTEKRDTRGYEMHPSSNGHQRRHQDARYR